MNYTPYAFRYAKLFPKHHRFIVTTKHQFYILRRVFSFHIFPIFPIILLSFHDVPNMSALTAGCFHLHVSFGKALDEV
jgi:hypothetical protein